MDEHEARALYEDVSRELKQIGRDIDRLVERKTGLRQVADGLVQLYPRLVETDRIEQIIQGAPPKSLPDALHLFFGAMPTGVWMTGSEVTEHLDAQGWLPEDSHEPGSAVRQALRRMAEKGQVKRRRSPDGRAFEYARLSEQLQQTPLPHIRLDEVRPATPVKKT